ncbi:putative monooxygenase p33MONOX isoform X4 [Dermochelys coriacea]|uniref:putative monooxygenase p33MONOX isoform X4 n=1 Tax=Dermochelys coriacea TaxID=27794 RepID=UPI001CA9CE68|nr:putative monooxygenase p33MONOX isoform X4 [Dermochelys coriacea]
MGPGRGRRAPRPPARPLKGPRRSAPVARGEAGGGGERAGSSSCSEARRGGRRPRVGLAHAGDARWALRCRGGQGRLRAARSLGCPRGLVTATLKCALALSGGSPPRVPAAAAGLRAGRCCSGRASQLPRRRSRRVGAHGEEYRRGAGGKWSQARALRFKTAGAPAAGTAAFALLPAPPASQPLADRLGQDLPLRGTGAACFPHVLWQLLRQHLLATGGARRGRRWSPDNGNQFWISILRNIWITVMASRQPDIPETCSSKIMKLVLRMNFFSNHIKISPR